MFAFWRRRGNDANTNPELNSWEIQEASRRGEGEKDTCQSAYAASPHINALSLLSLPDSKEYNASKSKGGTGE